MASVELDGKLVMLGNFWDFHPRCHGIYQYGEFSGYWGLVRAIEVFLLRAKEEVEVVEDHTWQFED
jgi:hypothetical protein